MDPAQTLKLASAYDSPFMRIHVDKPCIGSLNLAVAMKLEVSRVVGRIDKIQLTFDKLTRYELFVNGCRYAGSVPYQMVWLIIRRSGESRSPEKATGFPLSRE